MPTRTPAVFNVASFSGNAPSDTPAPSPSSSDSGAGNTRLTPSHDTNQKPLVQPDEDAVIDFGKAKTADEVVERPEPIDPTKEGTVPTDKTDAVDPTKAAPGKPKQDVKFDVDTLREKKTEENEEIAEDESEETEEPTAATKQPASNLKPGREYTGNPEIDEILSELPNKKYNKARQLLPELFGARDKVTELEKQLKERAPEQVSYYYDHPEAYTLDSDYRKAQQEFGQAEFERTHFERQLAAIEAGEPWQNLMGYDNKGNPIFEQVAVREDGRIDTQSKAKILGMLTRYGSIQHDLENKLKAHRSTFTESAKRGSAELQEVEAKIFTRWQDQKALTKEDSAALELVQGLYPKHMRSHPAIKHVGMAFREFQRLAEAHGATLKKLNAMEAELNKLKGKSMKPLPSGNNGSGNNKNGSSTLDEDDDVIDLKRLNQEFAKV